MTNTNPTLAYGVDDAVPPATLILAAFQHIAIVAPIGLVFPGLIARAMGATPDGTQALVSASLLALGIGSILLCARTRFLGTGFLAPSVFTAAYLPASLAAAAAGGLPLVAGMTVFAGFCEIGFSYVLRRLRPLLPSELAGLAVLMIGFTLGLLGFRLALGIDAPGTGAFAAIDLDDAALAAGSLALIIVLNVWCRGALRIFAVLIGVAAGYAVALLAGLVDTGMVADAAQDPFMGLPALPGIVPTFDLSLAPQFVIGALAASLRAMGDITTCQRIADRNWTRPEFGSIGRGLRADGLSSIVSGLLGSVGLNTFSGSIGLAQATGVMARRVGYAVGGLFIALAFFPRVVAVAAAIPEPITGAVLLFSATFIVANGLQIIVARLLDSRRIITIGLALILGVSHDVFFSFYKTLPSWLGTVASSSLVLALVTAFALNAVFRVGVTRVRHLSAPIDDALGQQLEEFTEESGAAWGAEREIMQRLFFALIEAAEVTRARAAPGAQFRVTLSYDEFHIDATARIPDGGAFSGAVAGRGAGDETEQRLQELPMVLMRHFADRVTYARDQDGMAIRLRFDT
ncbi:MAG: uracil-xanthine permease family protein [Alphaproteobacteria bacterium]